MKHSEEEMLLIAKNILQELNPNHFSENNLKKIDYQENDEISRLNLKNVNTWVAVIDDPIFDASEFLTISDETLEPLIYQTKHRSVIIVKDKHGKYTIS